jgi:hypothetical protein
LRRHSGETTGGAFIEGLGVVGHHIGLTDLVQVGHIQPNLSSTTGSKLGFGSENPRNRVVRIIIANYFVRGRDFNGSARHGLGLNRHRLHCNRPLVVGINLGTGLVGVRLE